MPISAKSPRLLLVVSSLAMAVGPGCSEELGPETMTTTRVEGTIRIAGRPVTTGWVEFLPTEGGVGNLRSAPIRADGSFTADGVAVGRVAVALANVGSAPVPTDLGPVGIRAFRSTETPIRRQIPAGTASRLDLDLAVEGLALRRSQAGLDRPKPEPKG